MTSLPSTTDCLILGGGVVGLSIAYELAQRGEQVVVIDRQPPGREASWAGAGILPPGSWYSDHPALEALARASDLLNPRWSAQLREETGIDNEFRVCGGVYLATDLAHRERLESKLAHWATLGIESQSIDGSQLHEMEPSISMAFFEQALLLGAYHVPAEAQLRNPLHLAALIAGCERRGVDLVYPVEIQAAERRDDREIVVRTSTGQCTCRRAILAAGAWSDSVARLFGFALPIKPIRGQMVLFGPQPALPLNSHLHVGPRYGVARRDGRVLVGTTVEDVGFDKRTTSEATTALADWGRTAIVSLSSVKVEQTWAGLRPASADDLPYLGRLSSAHNVYVAAGQFRAGLQFASGTAVALADLIESKPPSFDLEPLRPDR